MPGDDGSVARLVAGIEAHLSEITTARQYLMGTLERLRRAGPGTDAIGMSVVRVEEAVGRELDHLDTAEAALTRYICDVEGRARPPAWAQALLEDRRGQDWVTESRRHVATIRNRSQGPSGHPYADVEGLDCAALALAAAVLLALVDPVKGAIDVSLRTVAEAGGSPGIGIGLSHALVAVEAYGKRVGHTGSVREEMAASVAARLSTHVVPGVREIRALAQALRVVGVLVCARDPELLKYCACLHDLAETLGTDGLETLLAAG